MHLKDYINFENNIWIAKIKITPKSNKNEFFSVLDDWTLKVRIKAVPEKGKANKELIKFLAKEFGIKKDKVEILSGGNDQVKRIRLNKG